VIILWKEQIIGDASCVLCGTECCKFFVCVLTVHQGCEKCNFIWKCSSVGNSAVVELISLEGIKELKA
jgi:hypothetical protein